MSHHGGIRMYQGCLLWSNTSPEPCWSRQPLGSLSCSPKLFQEESSKDTHELRSHFRQGVLIFRDEGGTCAGGITQPSWEQPPVRLALTDGVKEPARADGTRKTASPVPAGLRSCGAGFRERTCKQ